jgi:hypothetical protein
LGFLTLFEIINSIQIKEKLSSFKAIDEKKEDKKDINGKKVELEKIIERVYFMFIN